MTPEIDAKIAALWPDKWAKANDPRLARRAKARNHLRSAYAAHVKFADFKARHPNASCGNCVNFKRLPHDTKGRHMCEADSDFHGYTIVERNGLCTSWQGAPAARNERTTDAE